MAIHICVEKFSGFVLTAVAATTPKCRPFDDTRPQIPAGIQDEIRLKIRLWRQWQVTRDPALKSEVNHLQKSATRRLIEWREDQWSATVESIDPGDQSLWRVNKRAMRVPTASPFSPRWESLSQTLKKPKPLTQYGGSVSAGVPSFDPGSY